MYKLFTSSYQLQLHLVKVVVRISMHAYVSLAQKLEAALFLSVNGLQHKSPAVHEQ